MASLMSNPRVSIVIPVYNGGNYLREAIDSALGQTYSNVEVLVINDGSDDGGQTERIGRSYGRKIRYISKVNGGVSSALNTGLANMSGEWFAWLSHDDFYGAERIAEHMKLAESVPDAKVIFGRQIFVDECSRLVRLAPFPVGDKFTGLADEWLIHACTMTIHRSCFDEVGGFNESNRTAQDCEMKFHLGTRFPFYLVQKAITYTREHSGRGTYQASAQHRSDLRQLADFIHEKLSLEQFFPDATGGPSAAADAWTWMAQHLYAYLDAPEYVRECYKKSLALQPSALHRLMHAVKVRSHIDPNPRVRGFCKVLCGVSRLARGVQ